MIPQEYFLTLHAVTGTFYDIEWTFYVIGWTFYDIEWTFYDIAGTAWKEVVGTLWAFSNIAILVY